MSVLMLHCTETVLLSKTADDTERLAFVVLMLFVIVLFDLLYFPQSLSLFLLTDVFSVQMSLKQNQITLFKHVFTRGRPDWQLTSKQSEAHFSLNECDGVAPSLHSCTHSQTHTSNAPFSFNINYSANLTIILTPPVSEIQPVVHNRKLLLTQGWS